MFRERLGTPDLDEILCQLGFSIVYKTVM